MEDTLPEMRKCAGRWFLSESLLLHHTLLCRVEEVPQEGEVDVEVIEEFVRVEDVEPAEFARAMHGGKPDSLLLGHFISSFELGRDWTAIKVTSPSSTHIQASLDLYAKKFVAADHSSLLHLPDSSLKDGLLGLAAEVSFPFLYFPFQNYLQWSKMDTRLRALEKRVGSLSGAALDVSKFDYGVHMLKERTDIPLPDHYTTPALEIFQSVNLLEAIRTAVLPPGMIPLRFLHESIKVFLSKVIFLSH